ncbi:uncharacterized protein LOC135377806 [Ornithodoros turicata]
MKMADKSEATLDGKPLQSFRVVDLRTALAKRGLPNSGTKKVLVERLKLQLKLESIQQQSVAVEGRVPNLGLQDELPAQNDFVRQYLLEQQKAYALQLEARRLAEKSKGESAEEPITVPVRQRSPQSATHHCGSSAKATSKGVKQSKRESWERRQHSLPIDPGGGVAPTESPAKGEPTAEVNSPMKARKTRISLRLSKGHSTLNNIKLSMQLPSPSCSTIEHDDEGTASLQHCSLLANEAENLESNQGTDTSFEEPNVTSHTESTRAGRRRPNQACQPVHCRNLPVHQKRGQEERRTLRRRMDSGNNRTGEMPKEAQNLMSENAYERYISTDKKLHSSFPIVVITPMATEQMQSTSFTVDGDDSRHSENAERQEEVGKNIEYLSKSGIISHSDNKDTCEPAHVNSTVEQKQVPFGEQDLQTSSSVCLLSAVHPVPSNQKMSPPLSIQVSSQVSRIESYSGEPHKTSEYLQSTEEPHPNNVPKTVCTDSDHQKTPSDTEALGTDDCLPNETSGTPTKPVHKTSCDTFDDETSLNVTTNIQVPHHDEPHKTVQLSKSLVTLIHDTSESSNDSQVVKLEPCVRRPLTTEETSSAVQSILKTSQDESITTLPDNHYPPYPSTHLYDDHEIASATHSLLQEMCPKEEEDFSSCHGELSTDAAPLPSGDVPQALAVSLNNTLGKISAGEEVNYTDDSAASLIPDTALSPTLPNLTYTPMDHIHDNSLNVQNDALKCSSEAVQQTSEMNIYLDSALTSLPQDTLIPPVENYTSIGKHEKRMEDSEAAEHKHGSGEEQGSHQDQQKNVNTASARADLEMKDILCFAHKAGSGSGDTHGHTIREGPDMKMQGPTHSEDEMPERERAIFPVIADEGRTTALSEDTDEDPKEVCLNLGTSEVPQTYATDRASKDLTVQTVNLPSEDGSGEADLDPVYLPSEDGPGDLLSGSGEEASKFTEAHNMKADRGTARKCASPLGTSKVISMTNTRPITTHQCETTTSVDMATSQEILHDLQMPTELVDVPTSSLQSSTESGLSASERDKELDKEDTVKVASSQIISEDVPPSSKADNSAVEALSGQNTDVLLKSGDQFSKELHLSQDPVPPDRHSLPPSAEDNTDTQRQRMDMLPSDVHLNIPLQWNAAPQGEIENGILLDISGDTRSNEVSPKGMCDHALHDSKQVLRIHTQQYEGDMRTNMDNITSSETETPHSVEYVSHPLQDAQNPFQSLSSSQNAVSPDHQRHREELEPQEPQSTNVDVSVETLMTKTQKEKEDVLSQGTLSGNGHPSLEDSCSRQEREGSTTETSTSCEFLLQSNEPKAAHYTVECSDQQANAAAMFSNQQTTIDSIKIMQSPEEATQVSLDAATDGTTALATSTVCEETRSTQRSPIDDSNKCAQATAQDTCGENNEPSSVTSIKNKVVVEDATTNSIPGNPKDMFVSESISQLPAGGTQVEEIAAPEMSTTSMESYPQECSNEALLTDTKKHILLEGPLELGTRKLQHKTDGNIEDPRLRTHRLQTTEATELKSSTSHVEGLQHTRCTLTDRTSGGSSVISESDLGMAGSFHEADVQSLAKGNETVHYISSSSIMQPPLVQQGHPEIMKARPSPSALKICADKESEFLVSQTANLNRRSDVSIVQCATEAIADQDNLHHESDTPKNRTHTVVKCRGEGGVEALQPGEVLSCAASSKVIENPSITFALQVRTLTLTGISDTDEINTSSNDSFKLSETSLQSPSCFPENTVPEIKNERNATEPQGNAEVHTATEQTEKCTNQESTEITLKNAHEAEGLLHGGIVDPTTTSCEPQQSILEDNELSGSLGDPSMQNLRPAKSELLPDVSDNKQLSNTSAKGYCDVSGQTAADTVRHKTQHMQNATTETTDKNTPMSATIVMLTQHTKIADRGAFESEGMTSAAKDQTGPSCHNDDDDTAYRKLEGQNLRPDEPCTELPAVMDIQNILDRQLHSYGPLTPPNGDKPCVSANESDGTELVEAMDEPPAGTQGVELDIHASPNQLRHCGDEKHAEDTASCDFLSQAHTSDCCSEEDDMARLRGRGTRRQVVKDAKAAKENQEYGVSDEDSESDSKKSRRLRNGRRAAEESDKGRKLRRSPRQGTQTTVENAKSSSSSSSSSSSESESADETVPESDDSAKKKVQPEKPAEEDSQQGDSKGLTREESPASGDDSDSSCKHSSSHLSSRSQEVQHSLPSEMPTRGCSTDPVPEKTEEESSPPKQARLSPVKEQPDNSSTRGVHSDTSEIDLKDSKSGEFHEGTADAPDGYAKEDAVSASSPPKFKARRLSTAAIKKEGDSKETDDKQQLPRKRRWGSTNVVIGPSLSISTNALKNLIPDLDESASVKVKVERVEGEGVIGDALASSDSEKSQLDVSTKVPVDEKPATIPEKKMISLEKTSTVPKRSVVPPRAAPASNREDKQPSPAKNPKSRTLFVRNLVRPFTLNQLKQLLKEFGDTDDSEFWIDKIKSKCFVTYMSEEDAVKAREALHQLRWPLCNPKILHVDFSTPEEMARQKEPPAPPTPTAPAPPRAVVSVERAPVTYPLRTVEVDRNSLQSSRPSREEAPAHARRTRPETTRYVEAQEPRGSPVPVHTRAQQPMREWDRDKLVQESPERAPPTPPRRERHSAERRERREKKVAKRKQEEDTPAKLLDDLFRKTKASPCIYWLPLTEDQIRQREEERRKRQLERERRRQQQQQEEEERRRKGMGRELPSRQRERDSRRSISRSPIRRR